MWLAVLLLLLLAVVAWPIALLVVMILALWFYPWVVLSLLVLGLIVGGFVRMATEEIRRRFTSILFEN